MVESVSTDASGETKTLARLYGESLLEWPKDLYIPPDALQVFLETFEGPLDLLLYLVRKANLNILDIQMAPLTDQYLEYVEAMRATNLELAAEYLLMAALLLEIKSRMLLPRAPRSNEEEEEDPRTALVKRLLEYERMKRAAAQLDEIPRVSRDFEWAGVFVSEKIVERMPELTLHDLQLAWLRIMRQARLHRHHQIRHEQLSVREHMSGMLRKLAGGGFVVFDALFDVSHGPAGLIVGYLAMLELVKEKLVHITQTEALAPIYVKLADGNA